MFRYQLNEGSWKMVIFLWTFFGFVSFISQSEAQELKQKKLEIYQQVYVKTLVQSMEQISPEILKSDSEAFLKAKKNLIDAKILDETEATQLKKALTDDQVTVTDFETLVIKYLSELQMTFQQGLKTKPDPEISIPEDSADLVSQVTDVQPLMPGESLFQLKLRFRDVYFPDSKATSENGFDRLTSVQQADLIARHLKSVMLNEIAQFSDQYRDLVKTEEQKSKFENQWLSRNSANFNSIATEIVTGNVQPLEAGNHLFASQPGFSEKLRNDLKLENERLNQSSDISVRAESTDQRKRRLQEKAIAFIRQNLIFSVSHPLTGLNDLDAKSRQALEQYLAMYAKPDIEDQAPVVKTEPDAIELPELKPVTQPTDQGSSRISQFKSKVYQFLRAWMKVQSLISLFSGGFGLEEFFLNKIIEAMEEILGGSLTAAEKQEARAWAAELAREVPRRPTTIGQPVQPINPLPFNPPVTGYPPPLNPYPVAPVYPPYVPFPNSYQRIRPGLPRIFNPGLLFRNRWAM